MITKDTLIVSMTSYPGRIHCVKDAMESITKQGAGLDCHYVLVLAEPEFPNGESDLPEDLVNFIDDENIELIWYPVNIRSHKKLMPTLKKYPDNPILVVDDDVIRQDGWLKMFIDDHRKYPNDVIAGSFMWYFGENLTLKRFDTYKCAKAGTMNGIPDLIFRFARPANGVGGTLYPAHTFTDPRFFDEDLMMKVCPTSDESWQFCFEIMHNVNIRQSSKIYDNSQTVIPGTQEMSSALHRVNKYPEIFKSISTEFPEFLLKLLRRQREVIVSFTTYKDRLITNCVDSVVESLMRQTWTPAKIVMCLYEGDVPYITPYLQKLIDRGILELLVTDNDIKPHKKYFNTMLKYREYPIITVDDDIIYDPDVVESLVKSYIEHPDAISARRVHKITVVDNVIQPYKKWLFQYNKQLTPSFDIFATNGAGTLFPPDILNMSEDKLPDIYECLNADDVYLKHLETKKGVKVVYVPNKRPLCTPIKNEEVQKDALYKTNVNECGNDEYIRKFKILPDKISTNSPKTISTACTYVRYMPSKKASSGTIQFNRFKKTFKAENPDIIGMRSTRKTNKQITKIFYN